MKFFLNVFDIHFEESRIVFFLLVKISDALGWCGLVVWFTLRVGEAPVSITGIGPSFLLRVLLYQPFFRSFASYVLVLYMALMLLLIYKKLNFAEMNEYYNDEWLWRKRASSTSPATESLSSSPFPSPSSVSCLLIWWPHFDTWTNHLTVNRP